MIFKDCLPVIEENLKFFDMVFVKIKDNIWGEQEITFSHSQDIEHKFKFFSNHIGTNKVLEMRCESVE